METGTYTVQEAVQYIKENDVRFIKLFFTDVYGRIKSISIQPSELERAFTRGIPFDASASQGFLDFSGGDLFLVPDSSTLCVLPWRPQSGRVVRFFCSLRYADGTPFEGDMRHLLCESVEKFSKMGFEFKIGTECEFYLFKCDEKGNPTKEPFDQAGYCDLAPRDRGENVRRQICLTLEQMGVHPESSHHEKGPGQNEVDFRSSDPLNAADNLQTFKVVVKTIAAQNGLFASFHPAPLKGKPGNGLHVNLSLWKDGESLLSGGEMADGARSFVAGLLKRTSEMTAFLNPIPASYDRLGQFEAPEFVSWGRGNRGQLVRIPDCAAGDSETGFVEFRSPDPMTNPYTSVSLILAAGMEGIAEKSSLADFGSSADSGKYEALPKNWGDALEMVRQSRFVRGVFPKLFTDFLDSDRFGEWNPNFCES